LAAFLPFLAAAAGRAAEPDARGIGLGESAAQSQEIRGESPKLIPLLIFPLPFGFIFC
jgi:hypothetical protein